MKRNLRQLQAGASGDSTGTSSLKRKIRKKMRRNRCHIKQARNDGIRRTSILEQIFGGEASRKRKAQALRDRQALAADRETLKIKRKQQRNYRNDRLSLKNYNASKTVCVRTCDGYFFPVSFSTDDKTIEGVAQACNALCPGRDMQLYYHKSSEQNAEDMTAIATGEIYADLPTAFDYRSSFNPNCSCNYRMVDRTAVDPDAEPKLPAMVKNQTRSTGLIGKPSWRDMSDEDILKGEITAEAAKAAAANVPPPHIEMSQNRRVRIIGESYFPSQ